MDQSPDSENERRRFTERDTLPVLFRRDRVAPRFFPLAFRTPGPRLEDLF
jgi:hypothetical protein